MKTAYSYIRFSSHRQADGDSLQRQTELRDNWLARHPQVKLDNTFKLHDLGMSAFHGKNATVGKLRTFLDAIKGGKIAPGSILIVESFDRLSRQGIDEGYDLVKSILKAGVKIVTLSPEREFDTDATKSLSRGALEIQLILERAAEENERRSERVGKARASGRERARSGEVITKQVPAWIKWADKKLSIDRDKAKTIRRMFRMTRQGVTLTSIAKTFNTESVPPLGRAEVGGEKVEWSASLVHHILKNRATIGEYQPYTGKGKDRKPSGETIANYYPAVIDRDEFDAVQLAMRGRKSIGRRERERGVNIFAGLLRSARTGKSLVVRQPEKRAEDSKRPNREASIFPRHAGFGRSAKWVSFPLRSFEKAVLSQLMEVTAADIQADDPIGDRVKLSEARLTELNSLAKKWRAKMDDPDLVDVVAEKLKELEQEKREVTARLNEARQEGAVPMSEAVGQFHTVGQQLDKDNSDENRIRCREALRFVVDSVWCLFMPGKGKRLAAVQVWFKSGAHRDYVIMARPGGASRHGPWPAVWAVRSLADAGLPTIDLRNKKAAEGLERALTKHAEKVMAKLGTPVPLDK